MANVNAPFGFQPFGVIQGMAPNFGFTPRKIAYGNATAIFQGDPVTTLTTGYIAQSTAGTTQIAGVFWGGVEYYSTAGKIPLQRNYWPGSDTTIDPFPAFIISNPNATFLVQTGNSNTAASAATLANVGMTANFAITAGNTANGRSGAYLDLYQAGSVTTQPFRILQLASDFLQPGAPGADPTTAYNWVLVGFNFQEMRSTTGHA